MNMKCVKIYILTMCITVIFGCGGSGRITPNKFDDLLNEVGIFGTVREVHFLGLKDGRYGLSEWELGSISGKSQTKYYWINDVDLLPKSRTKINNLIADSHELRALEKFSLQMNISADGLFPGFLQGQEFSGKHSDKTLKSIEYPCPDIIKDGFNKSVVSEMDGNVEKYYIIVVGGIAGLSAVYGPYIYDEKIKSFQFISVNK